MYSNKTLYGVSRSFILCVVMIRIMTKMAAKYSKRIIRNVAYIFYRFKTLLRVLFILFFIVITMNEIYFLQTVPMYFTRYYKHSVNKDI